MLLNSKVTQPLRRPRSLRFPALLLVAAITVAVVVTANEDDSPRRATPSVLPDPRIMSRAALGVAPIEKTVGFWQGRVNAAPNDLAARRLLAGSLMTQARESGDLVLFETAESQYRAAVAISPTSADAVLGLGGARAAQHDFATAAALATQVLQRDPQSVAALINLGDAQFELGQYTSARATYKRLDQAVPNTAVTLSRAARLAALDGDPTQSITLARQALQSVGDLDLHRADGAFFWFQLANYELNAGQPNVAARHLEQALVVDPSHLPSRELLARARVEQGDLLAARSLLLALTNDTPAADLFGDLAKVERRLGKRSAARAHLGEGLAIGRAQLGRFPSERRHLAGFFADADPQIALATAQQDYRDRQDIQSAGTLAWAEFRTGDFRSADRHSREALRFGTQDSVLQAQGGLIAFELGHPERAVTLLRAALDRRPNYDPTWAPRAHAVLSRLERTS